jgi:hypothetical protein
MKGLAILALSLGLLAWLCGCRKQEQIKLISDREWLIGEAKDCTVDGKWMEAHCFPPTPEGASAQKHDYLVTVRLEKALVFDSEGWAYNVVCRLESSERATCIQQAEK